MDSLRVEYDRTELVIDDRAQPTRLRMLVSFPSVPSSTVVEILFPDGVPAAIDFCRHELGLPALEWQEAAPGDVYVSSR